MEVYQWIVKSKFVLLYQLNVKFLPSSDISQVVTFLMIDKL